MTISTLSSHGLASSGFASASQRKSITNEATAAGAQQAMMLQSLGTSSSSGRSGPPPPPFTVSSGGMTSMAAMLNVQSLDQAEAQSSSSADFGATLQSMLEAIASGDTETAQAAASEITTLLGSIEADAASSIEDPGAMQFLADVKALASAVQSGSDTDLESALSTLSDGFAAGAAQGPMGPPPGPPPSGAPGGDLMSGITDLLSAIDEGDTEATSAAAETLQSMLDELAAESDDTTVDRGGLETDLQTLLDAVKSGDKTEIASAADTLTEGLSRAAGGPPPPMGPPPSDASSSASTLQTSLETALDTLSQILTSSESSDTTTGSSSETTSAQTAFLNSLRTLFEALSTGNGVDERVKAVVAAYSETSAVSAA